jgi:hypothetical protein
MKQEYEELLNELCEKKRQQYHESQRAELTRRELCRAECVTFTKRFVERFPHLKRVAGFYGSAEPNVEFMNATEHWWCVEPDGTIVDPTFEQFRPGDYVYTVFDKTKHVVRLGRCMECGDEIYGLLDAKSSSVCSAECSDRLNAYYNSI